jgi:hypothetical protein
MREMGMKRLLRASAVCVAVFGIGFASSTASNADTLFVGTSLNGGAITQQVSGTGAINTGFTVGDFTVSSVNVSGSASPLDLEATQLNASSTGSSGPQTLTIYISEDLTGAPPNGFSSVFTQLVAPSGWTITDSTFATNCPVGGCNSATSSFLRVNQLASNSFTLAPSLFSQLNAAPAGLNAPYEITEVIQLADNGNAGAQESTSINLTAAPLPSTWTMLGASLFGLGLLAYGGSSKRARSVSLLGGAAVA